MKFSKILLVMVLVAIGANIEVCAQVAQDVYDKKVVELATKEAELQKKEAELQKYEAKVDSLNKKCKILDKEKATLEEDKKRLKTERDKYFQDWQNLEKVGAEVNKLRLRYYSLQKDSLALIEANKKIKEYEEQISQLDKKQKEIENARNREGQELRSKIDKLQQIKTLAVDSLKMRVAAAKKMPLSQLAPRLNACEAEYKSLGEGDTAFDKVKTLLDSLSKDLKLFNDVNSVLNSPYSVKSVNSALATIEVLKKNSVGCVERLGELDKTAALLKEYESLVEVFNGDLVGYFKVIFEDYRKKSDSKSMTGCISETFGDDKQKGDETTLQDIKKISKIPYLKAQFEKYYEELNANPMDSSLEDRYIQKK